MLHAKSPVVITVDPSKPGDVELPADIKEQLQQASQTKQPAAAVIDAEPKPKPITSLTNESIKSSKTADPEVTLQVTIPVEQNKFVIDDTVQKIFIKVPAEEVYKFKLNSPNGKIIRANSAAKNIDWELSNKHATLIIENPETGQWEFLADLDVMPTVLVASSLELKVNQLPNNVLLGESLVLSSYLEQNGKLIRDPQKLKYNKFYVMAHNIGANKKYKVYLKDNGKAGDKLKRDGLYAHKYEIGPLPGIYYIDYFATGLTFQRLIRQQVYVHPTNVDIKYKFDIDGSKLIYSISLNPGLLNGNKTEFVALLKDVSGAIKSFEFNRVSDTKWHLDVPLKYKKQYEQTLVRVMGKTNQGRDVLINFSPIQVIDLYEYALAELDASKRAELIEQDTLGLGHMLSFSREKRAENAMVEMYEILAPDIPKPTRHYASFKQSLLDVFIPMYDRKPEQAKRATDLAVSSEQLNQVEELLDKKQIAKDFIAGIVANSAVKKAEPTKQKSSEPPVAKVKSRNIILWVSLSIIFMLIMVASGGLIWFLLRSKKLSKQSDIIKEQAESKPESVAEQQVVEPELEPEVEPEPEPEYKSKQDPKLELEQSHQAASQEPEQNLTETNKEAPVIKIDVEALKEQMEQEEDDSEQAPVSFSVFSVEEEPEEEPDQDETEPDQAKTEPDQAETESDQAETESDQAETESDQAETEPEQAETEFDQAETEPEQAEAEPEQATETASPDQIKVTLEDKNAIKSDGSDQSDSSDPPPPAPSKDENNPSTTAD